MSKYASTTFIAASAAGGETCNISVRLPKQLHGLWYPILHKPKRYARKLVASQATSPAESQIRLLKKQTKATANSIPPTTQNKVRNSKPTIGSRSKRIRA
jgi:hypothetical protein